MSCSESASIAGDTGDLLAACAILHLRNPRMTPQRLDRHNSSQYLLERGNPMPRPMFHGFVFLSPRTLASWMVPRATLALLCVCVSHVSARPAGAGEWESLPPVEAGKPMLRVEPIELRPNLLPNASFEEVAAGRPKSWAWDRRNTDAAITVDESVAHSGRRSLRITNSTAFAPHVYGMFHLPGGAVVKPDTLYTFSCYVKGSHIGLAWFGGGREWLQRARFPDKTEGGWMRVVLSFTTGPDDKSIPVLLCTETPCEPFWVDDVQLVEGPQPMPVRDAASPPGPSVYLEAPQSVVLSPQAPPKRWNTTRFPRGRYLFAPKTVWLAGTLVVPKDLGQRRLVVQVRRNGQAGPLVHADQTQPFPAGAYRVSAGFCVDKLPGGDVECWMGLGKTAQDPPALKVEASLHRFLVTPVEVDGKLAAVESLHTRLRNRVESLRAAGRDPAYPLVTLTILENFVGYAREDVAHGELARAYDAAVEMQELAGQALRREFLPPVPRYQTLPRRPSFRLDGPTQLGTVRWPDGRMESGRPLQLVGVGAFGQVVRDLEKLNGYGCNIIQVEFGPNSVLVSEDEVSTAVVDGFRGLLGRAAKAHVAVNLLVSPHYFPAWALEKWPHLRDGGGGFLGYDVYAPEARAVLEKFLRAAIPRIADHPALHSICLSNEPIFTKGTKSRPVRDRWHRWLAQEHGAVEALNTRWGTQYPDFASVPVPPAEFRPAPIVYDYIRFNQEAFAEFHAWMAGIVHELAPDVPVHAKIMMHAALLRHPAGPWSIAPERFAALSDFNGNDAIKYYHENGSWACGWQLENAGYDYQRSMADKPVFNSENHLIPDRNLDDVPPDHIANVFWQGAIHGQSATTTWVWERTYAEDHDFTGSIMHRPACVEAMGRTGLDLMRLAGEVAAFQRLPIQVALVWSPASLVAGQEYLDELGRAYEAMNFCGVRVGFITEHQLAEYGHTGRLPPRLADVKLLVLAGVARMPRAAAAAVGKFPARVVLGCAPRHDEYGRPAHDPLATMAEAKPLKESSDAFAVLRPRFTQAPLRPLATIETEDGQPVWGVEYLSVRHEGRILVNLCNYLREPQRCRIVVNGRPAQGKDLLSGQPWSGTVELPSLRPALVEIVGQPEESRR